VEQYGVFDAATADAFGNPLLLSRHTTRAEAEQMAEALNRESPRLTWEVRFYATTLTDEEIEDVGRPEEVRSD